MAEESTKKSNPGEVAQIKQQIKKQREALKDLGKAIFTALESHKDGGEITASPAPITSKFKMEMRRMLKGHFSKVFGVQWSGDAQKLVSAAQDGFMIVWNPMTCNKNITIPLKSTWIMMCAIEPLEGELTCTGGLDNTASVYHGKNPLVELHSHDGYLSSANFISEKSPGNLLTASGDQTIKLWDLSTFMPNAAGGGGKTRDPDPIQSFKDHNADVGSIDTAASAGMPQVFASGSTDTTCRFWDCRQEGSVGCVRMSGGDDVIQVKFFPDGKGVGLAVGGTGAHKGDMVLADMRCLAEVKNFPMEDKSCGPESTALAFSKSGRLLFGGYEDNQMKVFDVAGQNTQIFSLPAFDNARVADLAMSPGGDALAACSWDNNVKIFS